VKIIFLDFDGVLNHHAYYSQGRDTGPGDTNLDPKAIALLNKLIEETGAKVVVSSTWRLGRAVHELQELLEGRGFKGEVIGKTSDMRRGPDSDCILRGNEILQWIKECSTVPYWDFREYVILDDDSDMLYWQKDNFVHVDPFVGLTPLTITRAKRILGAPVTVAEI
jgi:hypothetical protein